MSLNWNLTAIADYETLCFIGEGEERRLNPVTDALIWYTLTVDIGQLTEKSFEEFFARMVIYDALRGPLLWEAGGYRSITREELRQHIGLNTNASFKVGARGPWLKRVTDNTVRDAIRAAEMKG